MMFVVYIHKITFWEKLYFYADYGYWTETNIPNTSLVSINDALMKTNQNTPTTACIARKVVSVYQHVKESFNVQVPDLYTIFNQMRHKTSCCHKNVI